MSQPPFDQDQPPRRPNSGAPGRERGPAPKRSPRRRFGPQGEGRRPTPKGPAGDRPDGEKRSTRSGLGPSGTLPRWALFAIGGFVVLILLLVLLKSCTGGSSRTDAGSCMSDAAAHLPAGTNSIAGTDYIQAHHNGYKDNGALEDIGKSIAETGVIPDPVTTTFRIKQLAAVEQFEAQTGVSPGDIDCSLGTDRIAVLTGSFNPSKVKGSDAGSSGRLAATEDRLAFSPGTPPAETMLEKAENKGLAGNEALLDTLEALRENDAYSLIVQRGDGTKRNRRPLAAGIGAAGSGNERTVVVAWWFADEDAANEGRPAVAEKINDVLRGTLSVRNSDLTVEKNMIVAVLPTRVAPDLQAIFDAGTRFTPAPK